MNKSRPSAIIFKSNTGHTKEYADMLGAETGLSVFSLKDAISKVPSNSTVVYLGWIKANHIVGFSKAFKKFEISVVCGVGLCKTGTIIKETRAATKIPDSIPLYTLRGGMDYEKLKGINKLLIKMLRKATDKKSEKQYDEMSKMLLSDENYVSRENLDEVIDYISQK